jgi:hypothetical protein
VPTAPVRISLLRSGCRNNVGTIGVVATSENAESGQVARTGVRASRDQVGQDVI